MNLSNYVPKATVDHNVSRYKGTATSTYDHSATTPRACLHKVPLLGVANEEFITEVL